MRGDIKKQFDPREDFRMTRVETSFKGKIR
jgi:hypothetical protein